MPRESPEASILAQAPPNPVLWVACGALAQQALRELHAVAEQLGVEIRGQFGFMHVGAEAERPAPDPQRDSRAAVSATPGSAAPPPQVYAWLETSLPATKRSAQRADAVADLEAAVRQVLRRLHPVRPEVAFPGARPPLTEVYVVVDLTRSVHVQAAVRVVEIIREETSRVDLTGILLTGRTATFEPTAEGQWEQSLREMIQANDAMRGGRCLLHRLYLLDGRDARQAWVPDQQSHTRMAAEFLFHHGLSSYRYQLRAHERRRVGPQQPVSEVFGSFACRIVRSDRESIGREVAESLLAGDLFPNRDQPLSPADARELDEVLERLDRRLEEIVSPPEQQAAAAAPPGGPDVQQRVSQALRAAIYEVCRPPAERPPDLRHDHDPLRRLQGFVERLPKLVEKVRMKIKTDEQTAERRRVSSRLRQDLGLPPLVPPGQPPPPQTPEPPPQTAEPLPPRPAPPVAAETPPLNCFVPVPVPRWRIGLGVAVAFCGAVAAGVLLGGEWPWQHVPLGVLLALLGALVLDWPTRWIPVPEQLIYPPYTEAAPYTRYRCRQPPMQVCLGLLAALIGAACLAGAFFPPLGIQISVAELVGAAIVLLIGAVFSLLQPRSREGASLWQDTHTVKSDYPLRYPWWRPVCLLFIAAAVTWVFFRWPLTLRDWDLALPLAWLGLGLFAGGVLAAVWPWTDQEQFQRTVPQGRFDSIFGGPRVGEAVRSAMGQVLRWLAVLSRRAPAAKRRQRPHWPEQPRPATFLEAVAANWPQRLADRCRASVLDAIEVPEKWADALLKEPDWADAELHLEDVAFIFTAHVVDEWLEKLLAEVSWSGLIQALQPDPDWLERFFEHSLAPMWPYATARPEIDTGIAAVDTELVAAAAAHVPLPCRYRVIEVDWPTPGRVVLVRIVQGLAREYLDPPATPTTGPTPPSPPGDPPASK